MNLFSLSKKSNAPRFNKLITDNFAYHQLKDPIGVLSAQLNQIKSSFGDHLVLKQIRMAEPREEIRESFITRTMGGGPRLKVDDSNLYMVAIEFEYFGKPIRPAYVRLPYILRGGKLIMDGRTSFVTPVMVDRGVNLNKDGMFVPLNRAKHIFLRSTYPLLENDFLINDNVLISELHTGKKLTRDKGVGRIPIKPTIFVYLMLKHGFTNAVKQFFGLDVEVYQGSKEQAFAKYPRDKYVIYSSAGEKPRLLNRERWSEPELHIIFKGEPGDHRLSEIAVNFFYIYDSFTTFLDKDTIESTDVWKYIAGHIIFNYPESNAKLAERIDNHLERSINLLIDNSTRKELYIDGIDVDDSYELFAWLIKNEKATFINKNPASLENKRLVSTRYTMAPINKAVTLLSYALENCKDNPPTHDKMEKIIRDKLREGLIRDIRKNNGEINSLQCPTDNIWLNISRNVVPQSKAVRGSGRDAMLMYKPENLLHPSLLVYAQVDGMPKSDPTRKSFINPYLNVDSSGNLSHSPKYDPMLKQLSEMIKYDYGFKEE
ncbi:hypothetical protein TSMG0037 [Halocynthia phage JM-2012]|uniref:polymerase n=1 Tax=Halocynthia phage JM-2012 TaxID=1173297 RepID=UPI00025C68F4|nr:polymerase [Halocynthia phage JM-2012]AFI55320.1 hypothetical protein TSMG0037 [Halocynthia phage JM-2012]